MASLSSNVQMQINHPINHATCPRKSPNVDDFYEGIPNGTIIDVLSSDGAWAYINYGSITGYVRCKYLSPMTVQTVDSRTIKPSNGKGASVFPVLKTYKKNGNVVNNVLLLGKEKGGQYAGTYSLFGGKANKGEAMKQTAIREFHEEMGNKTIGKYYDCQGSPFAFHQTHIELICLKDGFSISKSFKTNNEMSHANWFPIENILKSTANGQKSYLVMDVNGKCHSISSYAHGVTIAMKSHNIF